MLTSKDREQKAKALIPHAKRLAYRYRSPIELNLEEKTAIAMLAMVESMETYDPAKAGSFKTYMTKRVLWALTRYSQKEDTINRHYRKLQRDLYYTKQYLTTLLGHQPSHMELAIYLDLTLVEFQDMEAKTTRSVPYSMDMPLDDGEFNLHDFIADENSEDLDEQIDLFDRLHRLQEVMQAEPDLRIRDIMIRYNLKGETLGTIGKQYGISGTRVGQLIKKGKDRIKVKMELSSCDNE